MSRNGSQYHQLLNSAEWRRLRLEQLSRRPFCEDCRSDGVLTEATEVHHNVPVDEGATKEMMKQLAYDSANLVSLCHSCHVRRHKEMKSHDPETARRRARKEAEAFWERFGEEGA